MWVDPDQEYWIQYKRGWSRFSHRKADWLVLVPKWRHLWKEWILVLKTYLLDPTLRAKWLIYFTWYMKLKRNTNKWNEWNVFWGVSFSRDNDGNGRRIFLDIKCCCLRSNDGRCLRNRSNGVRSDWRLSVWYRTAILPNNECNNT